MNGLLHSIIKQFQFLPRKFLILSVVMIVLVLTSHPARTEVNVQSNYEIVTQAPFNQTSYYPINQGISAEVYQPTATWMGRLILPSTQDLKRIGTASDWCWLEVYHAPAEAQDWVGEIVRLQWNLKPRIETYVEKLTTDVEFSRLAKNLDRSGAILPTRLDGRSNVGPLQSLAGARPNDDMMVRVENVTMTTDQMGSPILQTDREPTQVTGQFYGLFDILRPISHPKTTPKACPGNPPCPSDYFLARPYNIKSQKFAQTEVTIRIPQQPLSRNDLFYSTPRNLENSPEGKLGWYLFGAKDEEGIFTAQAILPRRPFELKPDQVILGTQTGVDYIRNENWQDTPDRKGTAQSIVIDPNAANTDEAIQSWKEGDLALVIHLFGGIGGNKAEPAPANTVMGHFAYGIAEVIRDPITQELQFEIRYHQVYAHNTNAIISGTQTWANYMGNLQWGWLGTRPVSDILIKWEPFTADYNIEGVTTSPLKQLTTQLQIMAARYRTGDGTGVAMVTPTASCVQDANQALYITIESIKAEFKSNPKLQRWLQEHPNHPQTLRFQQLVQLGQELKSFLVPLGVIRPDWKQNSEYLAGVSHRGEFTNQFSLENIALSSETVMPRRAHDELSRIFLEQGAQLWLIRTNQIGGYDPDIVPVSPTLVLGR